MKSGAAGAIIAFMIGAGATSATAAEIRLSEQFSMGYLQFNVMKRDRLIEKYAGQRGLKDFRVSWQRFNGPAAMNEALLSGSTDIVAGGVREGEIAAGNAELLPLVITATIKAIAVHRLQTGGELVADADAIVDILLAGVRSAR